MQVLPASPRKRRRLAWSGGVGVALLALVLVVSLLPDHNRRIDREPAAAVHSEPAPAAATGRPREIPLTRATRHSVTEALARFIRTGVAGDHPEDAWDLTTDALHAASTRDEWAKKVTPFWRFPARKSAFDGWVLKYSYPGDVGLDIFLQPVASADTGPISFRAELKRIAGRWLVEAWQPMAMFSKPGEQAKVLAQPDLAPSQVGAGEQRISANWLLLPLGLLVGSIVLIPLAVAVSNWRKNRAVAAYLRDARERGGRAA